MVSTPETFAAATITGLTFPSALTGVIITKSLTPASFAGMAFIKTVEG